MTELYIDDDNINEFYNCNYTSISSLRIEAPKNINLLLDKLYKFINLQSLYLWNNKIKEIKGLDNLVNLQKLYLNGNHITEIKGLDKLVNLQKLYLNSNYITEIQKLDKLVNLQELYLHNNYITEIKEINNLINLKNLYLSYNKITEIKGIDKLINLQELYLNNNQIIKIEGTNTLISLHGLDLDNNQIIEIKGINNLISLQILSLYNNRITELKGLDNLINLQQLYLNNNKITKIKSLNNLINLQMLSLYNNEIKELPLSLCDLRNLNFVSYYDNPIEYIPLPVQRLLNRLNYRFTANNMIYHDNQNIHNHHIQNSFRNSLNNILKDKQLLDLQTIKQQILENSVLLEQSKREILNYCDDNNVMHSSYLITYSDLLIYVWSRIIKSTNKDDILQVLNQEISDGLCMCFTGRLTRLLNTLVGFYDDIELQISDSEQITNIIMSLKNKFHDEQLRDAVRKELLDRQYSETIINEWLDYI